MADGTVFSPPVAIPYSYARTHGVVMSSAPDGRPLCLHLPRLSLGAMIEIQRVAGPEVTFSEIAPTELDDLLARQYRDTAEAAAAEADATGGELAALADSAAEVDDLLDQRGDAPVVRLINALLQEAIKDQASDIHIETGEAQLQVRFRVDGTLRPVLTPRRSLAPLLTSRIKIMAGLDISEKRLPQDGRVSLRVGPHQVDVRVSTMPSQYGERIVLRLLKRDAVRRDLDTLGMSARDLDQFRHILTRPNGILLVTGPTGSGKTTSLYAALGTLDKAGRNIMTVEDPIEYAIDGIAQTQVNTRTGLTFARGFRAVLRQDPDVVMVGEIRDAETAGIAVQAAMSGHFVLSTLHTNSAIGSVTRLIDMGVERFLLAPMLSGLVAQRLVRTLCLNCRKASAATAADHALSGGQIEIGTPLFAPDGCEACHGTGYRGRTAIYEVVAVDREMEAMIHGGAAETDLTAHARRAGPGLLDDGIRAVKAGLTTMTEVARVAQDL